MSNDDRATMNEAPRISDLLESFRPGTDDLAAEPWTELRTALATEPALQQQADAVRRQDQVVRTAMHDLPVPAGLAERLLAGLELDEKADVLSAVPPARETKSVALPVRRRDTLHRGIWAAALLCTAAVAIAAVVVGSWQRSPITRPQLTQHELVEELQSWLKEPSLRNADAWHTVGKVPAEVSRDVANGVSVARYQTLRTGLGPAAVYELRLQGKSARLYVVNTQQSCYVAPSPYTVLPGLSASRTAFAWQRPDYLYVLVIDQGDSQVVDFVRVPRQA